MLLGSGFTQELKLPVYPGTEFTREMNLPWSSTPHLCAILVIIVCKTRRFHDATSHFRDGTNKSL